MVIIDSEESKSPRGPRPVPHIVSPPPYAPLPPRGSLPLPPPRSPGARPPPSPFSAPASNYLTVKREKADITGSWNIDTALSPPPLTFGRSFSTGSDRDSDQDAGSETGNTDSSMTQSSVTSSAPSTLTPNRPNLKLFSPRGKIDAAIRVSGGPRAVIETISRDEDVALTFPPNPNKAPRPPIQLLARSTQGNVQVHLPYPFMGTLRVPSDTVLPPTLKSMSVMLAPSEPPIDRPPILDESSVKPRLGSLPSRATTPTPASPPLRQSSNEITHPETPASPPPIFGGAPLIDTPMLEYPPAGATTKRGAATEAEPVVTITAPEATFNIDRPPAEPAPIPALLSPESAIDMKEEDPKTPTSPPPDQASSPPLLAPQSALSSPPPEAPPVLQTTPNLTPPAELRPSSRASHHRSASASSHHRSPSVSSTLPSPAPPKHDSTESSTIYFIGDYLNSGYLPEGWSGDEFVIDSECGRVRVCWYGEKADVPWTEDVTSKVKDAMDWSRWKSSIGLKDSTGTVAIPKMSVSGLGKRFGFGK